MKRYEYFLTERPPMPGALPKDGLEIVLSFDEKEYHEEIEGKAWGKAWYSRPLTHEELLEYELAGNPKNPIETEEK